MLSTLKTPMMEAANGKKNEGVPTVDLKGLPALTAPGDLNSLKEIGENLDNALKLYGGTYLTNTGVPPKAVSFLHLNSYFYQNFNSVLQTFKKKLSVCFQIQNLLLHSRNFFEKPEASKLKYESKRRKMVGCPVAEYFGYYRSKEQMFRERFDFPLGWGGALAYPEAVVAGITESVKECQSALNSVASFVLARMEEVLGLEKKELSQIHLGTLSLDKEIMTKSHISSIFYNYTPTGSHNLELMEAHTDKSSMTFLYSTAPGLQVQVKFIQVHYTFK